MHEISDIGKEMLRFQADLAHKYKYKPIPIDLFLGDVREKYRNSLPPWVDVSGNTGTPLYSASGTQICHGYNRVVIGDYGAFVEISPELICKDNLMCEKGQEFRSTDERYSKNVKYLWLTTTDGSHCKIYHQKKTVDYADYQPDMYYISPYEAFVE